MNPPMTLPVNPLGGTNPPIVTHPPLEGGHVNHNIGATFNIHVNEEGQPEIDDPHDASFLPKVDSVYNTFEPSTAEVEKKFCILEENMKYIEGSCALD